MTIGALQQKEVELMGRTYIVYLKEVPTKIEVGGKPKSTTLRAFIKRSS